MEENQIEDVKIGEKFTIISGTENAAEIQQIWASVRGVPITHLNYLRHYEKVQNVLSIVFAQIENEFSQYLDKERQFKDIAKTDRIKNALKDNYIPPEVYEVKLQMQKHIGQMIAWFNFANGMQTEMLKKFAFALNEAKQFETQRDVLQQMKEMEGKRNELLEKVISTTLTTIVNDFKTALQELQGENRLAHKEDLMMVTEALQRNNAALREQTDKLYDIICVAHPAHYDDIKALQRTFDEGLRREKVNVVRRGRPSKQDAPKPAKEPERKQPVVYESKSDPFDAPDEEPAQEGDDDNN